MTRTKQKLVEFLTKMVPTTVYDKEKIADRLIESGWVQLDKPFERWEIRHEGAFIQDFKSEHEAKVSLDDYFDKENMRIIHVKEVLEGSEG